MDVKLLKLNPGSLSHAELESFFWEVVDSVELSERCWIDVENSRKVVDDLIEKGETVYGLNTGFGLLANKKISTEDLAKLQINLVRSHSAGTGALLDSQIVRLIMLLKATSLARGFSGIRKDAIQLLMECINRNWIPSIPEKGSVGASGDLAPLAHLSLALVGEGEFLPADGMSNRAQPVLAKQLFEEHCVQPLQLEAKEGLALLNGTQVSTALAIAALYRAKRTFRAALIVGALSVDAAKGSDTPFDARIHEIRNHQSQIKCAELYRKLLAGSKIRDSHRDCSRVQDPYSLRCQPQVMGACLNSLEHAASVLIDEANAVSDNPLVFSDDGSMLSGGNFHAEPVGLVADQMAVAIAEIGSLSERRIALLIDKHLSELPPFLVEDGGLNSGFMIPQVTAAALASENKHLASPCSTDSVPTSANQEDHVSMATYAARRLEAMIENVNQILAIELLAACQGIEFHRPLKTSRSLEAAFDLVRQRADFYSEDRTFHVEIDSCAKMVASSSLDVVLGVDEIF